MSILYPELVDLVERLHAGEPLAAADLELLEGYADPPANAIEDQLDGATVKLVEELTGSGDVYTPERAARALLADRRRSTRTGTTTTIWSKRRSVRTPS